MQQKEGSLMQQTASATPSRQERRVRRTRAMILAGFIQLMQQKPVKDISVRELADLVDINRSTFYLHYTDIYDLLEQTENGLMDQFLAIIDKNDLVHMAHMDIHYGFSINGVASLHTDILKETELHQFYEIYPEKFNNKTNGITFRRWLLTVTIR